MVLGTCELMCPVKEREQRERDGELHVFERVERDNRKVRTGTGVCVKRGSV